MLYASLLLLFECMKQFNLLNNFFQDFSESDKARSVRLLLAKHSDQVNQLISRQPTQITRSNNNLDPSSFETSDDFVSHNHILPGDRY